MPLCFLMAELNLHLHDIYNDDDVGGTPGDGAGLVDSVFPSGSCFC